MTRHHYATGAITDSMAVVGQAFAIVTALAMSVGEVVARLHTSTTSHTTLVSPITKLIGFTTLNTLLAAGIVLRVTIASFLREIPVQRKSELNIVMICLVMVGLLVTNRKAMRHLVSRVRGWLALPMAATGQDHVSSTTQASDDILCTSTETLKTI